MAPFENDALHPTRRGRAPSLPERRLVGVAISDGIAIGPVFGAAEPRANMVRRKIAAADIASQTARLDGAVAQSRKQLLKLRARLGVLPEDSQAEIAPLLDAYLQMVGPSRLLRGIRRHITDMLVSAETAVVDASEEIAGTIRAMDADDDDPAGRERHAEEVR